MRETREVELQIDANTLLMGIVVETTETIGGPYQEGYATEPVVSYSVEDFHLMIYIEGMEYDLTKGLREGEVKYFTDWLIEEAAGKFR